MKNATTMHADVISTASPVKSTGDSIDNDHANTPPYSIWTDDGRDAAERLQASALWQGSICNRGPPTQTAHCTDNASACCSTV